MELTKGVKKDAIFKNFFWIYDHQNKKNRKKLSDIVLTKLNDFVSNIVNVISNNFKHKATENPILLFSEIK